MSYSQTMKWGTKHRRGTRQPLIMSTGSGVWLSGAFIRDDYLPYVEACKSIGAMPISANDFYQHKVTSKIQRDPNAAFALHAVNAYPKLVLALRAVLGVSAHHRTLLSKHGFDQSPIEHDAEALLRELGE